MPEPNGRNEAFGDVPETSGARLAALAALVVLLLTLARIWALVLSETDLFFDEAQYWYWGQDRALGYYSKPPMIGWVIGGVTALCGDSEFCVRLPAPLFHAVTAMAIFSAAARLYDAPTAVVAALAWATLPGVSLGSSLISTDTVLLSFWAMALALLVSQAEVPRPWKPLALGVALGLGLLSKYAMLYWFGSALIAAAVSPRWRRAVVSRWMALASLIALALLAPNLWWNATTGQGATLRHTVDNANWSGELLNPGELLAFFGGQVGVFGPVLFAALLGAFVVALRGRGRLGASERLLLAFSLPILLLVSAQALISRAHANWAAPAYVAACILVAALLLRGGWKRVLGASFLINGAAAVLIAWGATVATSVDPPIGRSPYERTLGWRMAMAGVSGRVAEAAQAGSPFAAAIGDGRKITAEMFYYLRDAGLPLRALRDGDRPGDHFEMVAAYEGTPPGRLLIVSRNRNPAKFVARFGAVERLEPVAAPSSPGRQRIIHLYAVPADAGSEPGQ